MYLQQINTRLYGVTFHYAATVIVTRKARISELHKLVKNTTEVRIIVRLRPKISCFILHTRSIIPRIITQISWTILHISIQAVTLVEDKIFYVFRHKKETTDTKHFTIIISNNFTTPVLAYSSCLYEKHKSSNVQLKLAYLQDNKYK